MDGAPPDDLAVHLARIADALESVARTLAAVVSGRPVSGVGVGAAAAAPSAWSAVRCDDVAALFRLAGRAGLSARCRRALLRAARQLPAGTLADLARLTPDDWMELPDCGVVTARALFAFFAAGPPPPPAADPDARQGGD